MRQELGELYSAKRLIRDKQVVCSDPITEVSEFLRGRFLPTHIIVFRCYLMQYFIENKILARDLWNSMLKGGLSALCFND
jgi:hypothetical protein